MTKENKDFTLVLYAPLTGTTVALEDVPDTVFAQKMVGDGISLQPTSDILKAPCAGKVTNIHPSHHALTLHTEDGIDVLMHIGLDTVEFKGKGFTLKTAEGKEVKIGDSLIEFDFAYLSQHAKSVLTEIIVTSSDKELTLKPEINKQVTVGEDVILTVHAAEKKTSESVNNAENTAVSWIITVPNPTGFHARPAALLAAGAKKFQADIKVIRGNDSANAKSVVSIMGLNIGFGDKIRLEASGDDAEEALFALLPLLEEGLEENGTSPEPKPAKENVPPANPNLISGIGASDGIAVGFIKQMKEENLTYEETAANPETEVKRLNEALDTAEEQLEEVYTSMSKKISADKADIFRAHQELISDPELRTRAYRLINEGKSAEYAWKQTTSEQAEKLAALHNDLLAGRATDLRDVGKRVLKILRGEEEVLSSVPDHAILVAEELTPSDTAALDKAKIAGLCTVHGGATSHVSILARTLGLPAITGAEARVLKIPDGTEAVIDGSAGTLKLNPSQDEIKTASLSQEEEKKHYAEDVANASKPAITTDGKQIEVGGNVGNLADVSEVLKLGGEGVGLLRSEFLFLNRDEAPSEAEQAEAYQSIAKALGRDKKLIVRTLDVGGDKKLPYLDMPPEENPFLGVRGIRLCLAKPEIFRPQIRAILSAAPFADLHIMFPMVSRIKELQEAKSIVEEEKSSLNKEISVKIGIMVEIPSAAVMVEDFAEIADFFSLGTNDLTQYTLAMDRGNPALAKIADGLHPAVLRLIKKTIEGAHKYNKFVGVCGGMAGDLNALPLLIGLGVDELSVAPPSIPIVKHKIRELSFKDSQNLAEEVLSLPTATSVRAKLKSVFAN